MRKILILLTALSFISCSSDDDEQLLREQILGKWQVEYSKTIYPAVYVESEDEFDELKEIYPDVNFKLGVNILNEVSQVTEYIRDEKNQEIVPESAMFGWGVGDTMVEFMEGNFILDALYLDSETNKIMHESNEYNSCKIEDGVIIKTSRYLPAPIELLDDYFKYTIDKDILTIEYIKAKYPNGERYYLTNHYCISKYSRIAK